MSAVRNPRTRDLAIDPSLRGFCARNGVGRTKAYQEIAAGRLAVHKIGRNTVVFPDDEAAWRSALPDGVSQ